MLCRVSLYQGACCTELQFFWSTASICVLYTEQNIYTHCRAGQLASWVQGSLHPYLSLFLNQTRKPECWIFQCLGPILLDNTFILQEHWTFQTTRDGCFMSDNLLHRRLSNARYWKVRLCNLKQDWSWDQASAPVPVNPVGTCHDVLCPLNGTYQWPLPNASGHHHLRYLALSSNGWWLCSAAFPHPMWIDLPEYIHCVNARGHIVKFYRLPSIVGLAFCE